MSDLDAVEEGGGRLGALGVLGFFVWWVGERGLD